MKIIIYQSNIIRIGGVETFTYNLSKKLSEQHEVLVLYQNCDKDQLKRLQSTVNVEKYDSTKYYMCDICICASSWGGYPDKVEASTNKYIQVIHADYKELAKTGYKYTPWSKTTMHVAVSNTVRDIFNEMYNVDTITIYNLLDDLQPVKPILRLVSACRLSGEKGYNRMVILANMLKKAQIKFEWKIFTDVEAYSVQKMDMEEIIYMKPTLDIIPYLADADYGVQLSDTEGYSYFVNECLQYGTAVIATKFDSVHESVIDGVNGYILDMDMKNIDIDKIVNHIPKNFNYEPKCKIEDWYNLFDKKTKIKKKKPIKDTSIQDSLARQRGFASHQLAKEYAASTRFANLAQADKREFLNWLDSII